MGLLEKINEKLELAWIEDEPDLAQFVFVEGYKTGVDDTLYADTPSIESSSIDFFDAANTAREASERGAYLSSIFNIGIAAAHTSYICREHEELRAVHPDSSLELKEAARYLGEAVKTLEKKLPVEPKPVEFLFGRLSKLRRNQDFLDYESLTVLDDASAAFDDARNYEA